MKKTVLFLLILISTLHFSCVITQEYSFNEDFSGSAKTEIDLSQMLNFISEYDTTESKENTLAGIKDSVNIIADKIKSAGGKNVKVGLNDANTSVFVYYEFEDVEALNEIAKTNDSKSILKGSIHSESGNHPEFKTKKRKLIYTAPKFPESDTLDMSSMESMKDLYQYNLIFHFSKEIKKVDNKNAEISKDKKSITFKGNIIDMFSPKYNTDFTVKLKRK